MGYLIKFYFSSVYEHFFYKSNFKTLFNVSQQNKYLTLFTRKFI